MTENVWMCDAIVERDMVVGDRVGVVAITAPVTAA